MDISFTLEFEKWQRDFRYKTAFFLRSKFRKRLGEMLTTLEIRLKAYASEFRVTGGYENSIVAGYAQDDVDGQGFTFYVGPKVPYAQFVEYGRCSGGVPWHRIAEWVEKKLGTTNPATIANIRHKIATRGFDGNLWLNKALNQWMGGEMQNILNQVGLDAKETFEGNVE